MKANNRSGRKRGLKKIEQCAALPVLLMAAAFLFPTPGLAADMPITPLAKDRLQPRIVNGLFTSDYPSVGVLLDSSNPNTAALFCSGTMIGCETFLTAGHCVEGNLNPAHYGVFLQHAGFFSVASVTLHPSFAFPVGDVAIIKLSTPITGIAPSPINTAQDPPAGTNGVIAGFGRSGGSNYDYGLKRFGDVVTANCAFGVSGVTSVCWDFANPLGPAGTDSNTCNGDSGGPLFIDFGSGAVVAGVTSGGNSGTCLPNDNSYDANVYNYRSWIQTQAGTDLNNTSCGNIAQVGDPSTAVFSATGQLASGNTQATHSFAVASGTDLLRVAMNAHDDSLSDFDLYVKSGSPPTTANFDCAATGPNQYGFCEFANPTPGNWYLLVSRSSGSGKYQVTATTFQPQCAGPGNGGAACDDGNACTQGDTCQAGVCAGTPVANGTTCDDGNQCTSPDTCQSSVCTGSSLSDGTACSDGNACTQGDHCQAGTCLNGQGPAPSCKQTTVSGRAFLSLKNNPNNRRDRFVWKWTKGEATSLGEFGDPTAAATYTLCLYDEQASTPTLVMQDTVPATGGNWKITRTGYKYKNSGAGIDTVRLKTGASGKASIIVKGHGQNLNLPTLPLNQDTTVTVQLLGDNACWEANFSTNKVSSAERFKAKGD